MMIDILHHLEVQHKQMLDRLTPPPNGSGA